MPERAMCQEFVQRVCSAPWRLLRSTVTGFLKAAHTATDVHFNEGKPFNFG